MTSGSPAATRRPSSRRRTLTQAGFPNGFKTKIEYRNVFRGYLPRPPVVAAGHQGELAAIGIDATVNEVDSGTFIGNANAGKLDGLFLLGWGADYPEVTNFLDYHFGAGCTAAFGKCMPEISGPLGQGNSTTDDAARTAAYTEANKQIQALVPMVPIAHGQYANAYLAGTEGAQVSAISTEVLWGMKPPASTPDTVVFMQNAEPIGLYCADETDGESLRACEQSMEGLYGYAVGGTDVVPSLATSCDPNTEGTVWTCKLRQGVTFHDGSTSRPRTWSPRSPSSGMRATRSTRATPVSSSTGAACGVATSTTCLRRRPARPSAIDLAVTGARAYGPRLFLISRF